jgi:PPP family 3-phenylpropionic acid transporter
MFSVTRRTDASALSMVNYLRMSLFYFLFYTTVAVFSPYFNLYLNDRGLNGEQVGTVLAILPLMGLVMQPMWGMLNDRFHIQKTTLLLSVSVPPALLLVFPHLHAYVGFLFGAACLATFQTAAAPVADSMTIQNAGLSHYGKIRMFGSLGYAIVVAIAAQVYHVYGVHVLPVVALLAAGLAVVGLFAYPKPVRPNTVTVSALVGLRELLTNRRFLIILAATFLVSIGQIVNSNFFTLYYRDLGRPMGWLGVVLASGALSELPFFFWSGRLMERHGPEKVFFLGGTVFMLRWLVLCFEPNTWVIMVVQLFHGISFGLTFAAGVALAARVSDESRQVTAQTVYSAVNTGLAAIAGSMVGGYLLQSFGPRGVYEFAFVISLVGLIVMTLVIRQHKYYRQIRIRFDK